MTPSQFPPIDLALLAAAANPEPEQPLPWWWELIPIVAVLCIWGTTFYAIGRL